MHASITHQFIKQGTDEDRFAAISKAGFSYVNISGDLITKLLTLDDSYAYNIADLLNKYFLKVDWVHSPYVVPNLYTVKSELWALSICAIKATIRIASIFNAKTVVVHPYNPEFSFNENINTKKMRIIQAYHSLVNYGLKYNVTVAVENMIERESYDIISFLLDNIKDLMFCFDTGHAQLSKRWKEYLSQYINRIVALHMHDNLGIIDNHLIPGQGVINFNQFINTMIKNDYKGIWGLECLIPESETEVDLFESTKNIFQTIHNLIHQSRENILVPT